MAESLVKLVVHVVFHVKATGIPLHEEDLPRLYSYIGGIVKGKSGILIAIGGVTDHVHLLAVLPKAMSMVDFVKTIKQESSKWLKTIDAYYRGFSWQAGYAAFSVSPSLIDRTVNYINHQKTHHARRSFQEELKAFLDAYGMEYNEQYAFN